MRLKMKQMLIQPDPKFRPKKRAESKPIKKRKPIDFRSPSAPPSDENLLSFGRGEKKSDSQKTERYLTPKPPQIVSPQTPVPTIASIQEKNSEYYLNKGYLTRAYELCLEINGSKHIQYLLDTLKFNEKKELINCLLPHTDSLMRNIFGNYVIQKIIEIGTDDHRDTVIKHIDTQIFSMALDTYGCRVLQKALEELGNVPMFVQKVVFQLKKDLGMLMKHQNGNHVIQKLLDILPIAQHDFMIEAIKSDVAQMSE